MVHDTIMIVASIPMEVSGVLKHGWEIPKLVAVFNGNIIELYMIFQPQKVDDGKKKKKT